MHTKKFGKQFEYTYKNYFMKKTLFYLIMAISPIIGFSKTIPTDVKLTLKKLNGKTIKSTTVYFTIDAKKKSLYGKSGCNNFNLSYTANKEQTQITTGKGMSTMMACDEVSMNLENDFLKAIQDKKFTIATKGNIVQFKNVKGKIVLELEQQTTQSVWNYIGKNNWKLISLNNVSQEYGDAALKFDVKTKTVNGNTGCNRFFGNYKVNGEYITFAQMGATKMACANTEVNKTETELLKIFSDRKLRFDVADQTLNFYDGDRLVAMYGIVR